MARAPNYGFEKRKKEQDRKAKKDAKREDRRLRRLERDTEGGAEGGAGESTEGTPAEGEATDQGTTGA